MLLDCLLQLLDEAVEGNLGAFSVITDRLEGKPSQSVDMNIRNMTHEEALAQLDDIDE